MVALGPLIAEGTNMAMLFVLAPRRFGPPVGMNEGQ